MLSFIIPDAPNKTWLIKHLGALVCEGCGDVMICSRKKAARIWRLSDGILCSDCCDKCQTQDGIKRLFSDVRVQFRRYVNEARYTR